MHKQNCPQSNTPEFINHDFFKQSRPYIVIQHAILSLFENSYIVQPQHNNTDCLQRKMLIDFILVIINMHILFIHLTPVNFMSRFQIIDLRHYPDQFICYIIQMKRIQAFTIFLTLISILWTASTTTAPPTWKGTTYIQAGTRVIVLNGAHQSGSNIYTYTYNPAFSSTPFTALGLIGMQTSNLYQFLLKFWINIPNYTSTTSLQINMTSPTSTTWRQYRVSYIAIDARFNQLKVDYFFRNSLTNVTTGTGLRSYYGVFNLNIGSVDVTHKISIIPLLIGLNSQSVNGEHVIYWDTKLKTASSIDYNLTVDRTTRIFQFVSYILVVDKTNAEGTLQIFMDELYIGGRNNVPVYQTPVYYNLTNMHAGLNSIRTRLIAFNFDKSSFLLTSLGYYQFINISIWSYRQRDCPVPQPYYEINTNLCYDTCPVGYVNTVGTTKQYCKYCGDIITACLECTPSGAACTKCAGNYQPSGSTCACPAGFYVSSSHTAYADKCRACDSSCLTCNGPNNYNCLTCSADRSFDFGKCTCTHGTAPSGACYSSSCSDQACTQCNTNPNLCQVCAAGFVLTGARCTCPTGKYFDLATVSCLDCHYSCTKCSGPSSTECTQCDRSTNHRYLTNTNECLCVQGYSQVSQVCQAGQTSCTQPGYMVDSNGACIEICGDGNKIGYACDDGNQEDGDGCSKTCDIQAGFICTQNVLAPNKRSFCSYTSPISLTLISTRKNIYKNSIAMNFTLQPSLVHVLSVYPNLMSQINLSPSQLGLTLTKAYFNSDLKILEIEYDYGSQVHNQEMTLQLSMPLNAHTYAIPSTTSKYQISPNNKLVAQGHDDSLYNTVSILKIIGLVSMGGGLACFIILAFFRKMMGLQFIAMLQLAYFSIMLSNFQHAYLGSLQEWDYVNGYNKIKVNIPAAKLVDDHFAILGYKDYFFINCNAMIFVCFANYGLALILYILSMLSDKSVSRKLKTSAIFFCVQIGFSLIVFSLNNIIASIFCQVKAGHIFQFDYGLNKFFVFLVILMFFGQMGGYFMKIHEMNDSVFYYHRNKNYCHYYAFIFVLRNVLIMVFVALALTIGSATSFIALGVEAAYIIGVFAGRPYKRGIDYARFIIVQLTLTLLLVCRLVQANFISNFSQIELGTAKFLEISALCILAGMLLSFLITVISFGYHWWKSRTQDPQVKPQQEVIEDIYSPPKKMSDSHQKFKLQEQEKSKQIIVFDVDEQDQNTGAAGTQYKSYSIFDKDSRRKLRSRKIKNESKQFF